MRALRRLRDGRLEVHSHPTRRLASRFSFAIGLVWVVGGFAAGSNLVGASLLALVGLLFFGLGWIYRIRTWVTVIDPDVRTVTRGSEQWRSRDLVGLGVGTKVEWKHSAEGPQRDWSLWLIENVVDLDTATALDSIETSDATRERLERWGPYLRGRKLVLTTVLDQREAWRVGEFLAKSLDLPVVDCTDPEPVLRPRGKLDQSVPARLLEEHALAEDPGPAPDGLECKEDRGALVVRWVGKSDLLWVNQLIFAAFGGFGVWAWLQVDDLAVFGGLTAGVALLVMLALWLRARGSGPNQLRVERDAVFYETSRPWYRCERLAISELERIRTHAQSPAGFSLVSDGQIFELRLSPAQSEWLAAKLRFFLVREASAAAEDASAAPP